jgi:DNA ligase-1
MKFADFADRAAAIEAVSADTAVVDRLVDLFVAADEDLPVVTRFVQGRIFPAWQSRTLDVGPSLCHEAIARAAGPNVTSEDVETRLADYGEIGAVAASYDFGGQRGLAAFGSGDEDALSVADVTTRLDELASAAGAGSRDRKRDALFGLFTRSEPEQARYLARLVLSEMRIGVGGGAVRDAVAEAFDVPVGSVRRALQVTNDYGRVAELARDEGESGLADLSLTVGRPVQAMLAQAGTAATAVEEWETVAVETKFDGARVQVHVRADAVDVYSRNMEDVTEALPEVVEFVRERVDAPAILDGEVVAVDDDGDPLPFQEVLRRFRRKHDVDRLREEVRVVLRAFDCLHADGRDLLDEPLLTRHDHLTDRLDDGVSDLHVTDDIAELAEIESAALEAGHEGVMLKNPASTYTPGDRGRNWLKRKPDVETLDLVVTGAEWGEGRRANCFGTFELAARTDEGGFETLGKVATGITDEELESVTERLREHVVSESGQTVDVRPEVVFEVGYEEIQRSPTYSSGYALRFPRFLGVREDKTPDDADAMARIERLADDAR